MVPTLVFRKTFERSLIYQLSLPQKTYLSVYAYPPPPGKKKKKVHVEKMSVTLTVFFHISSDAAYILLQGIILMDCVNAAIFKKIS